MLYSLVCAVILAGDETRILPAVTALKYRLADFIDPDFGLLEELLRLEVLTRRACARVRSERTVYERNDTLLDLLTSEDQCVKFLKALQRTGQQHVVNYIEQNGGQKHSHVITYLSNVAHSNELQTLNSHLFYLLGPTYMCSYITSIACRHRDFVFSLPILLISNVSYGWYIL